MDRTLYSMCMFVKQRKKKEDSWVHGRKKKESNGGRRSGRLHLRCKQSMIYAFKIDYGHAKHSLPFPMYPTQKRPKLKWSNDEHFLGR